MLTTEYVQRQLGELVDLASHLGILVADAVDVPTLVLARVVVELDELRHRLEALDLQLHDAMGQPLPLEETSA